MKVKELVGTLNPTRKIKLKVGGNILMECRSDSEALSHYADREVLSWSTEISLIFERINIVINIKEEVEQ